MNKPALIIAGVTAVLLGGFLYMQTPHPKILVNNKVSKILSFKWGGKVYDYDYSTGMSQIAVAVRGHMLDFSIAPNGTGFIHVMKDGAIVSQVFVQ